MPFEGCMVSVWVTWLCHTLSTRVLFDARSGYIWCRHRVSIWSRRVQFRVCPWSAYARDCVVSGRKAAHENHSLLLCLDSLLVIECMYSHHLSCRLRSNRVCAMGFWFVAACVFAVSLPWKRKPLYCKPLYLTNIDYLCIIRKIIKIMHITFKVNYI